MLRALGVLLSYVVARIAPRVGIGWLVDALDSPSEDARTMAYMALVKLGSKHTSKLLEMAKSGRQTASLLQVIGDVAEADVVPELNVFAQSDDEAIATAARDSIEAINERTP